MTSTLTDLEDEAPLSVGELVHLLSGCLERDFSHLMVVGELTAVSRAASGHIYFTLSDKTASVDAVLWRSDAFRLTFKPAQGDEVLVRGRMGVFARSGRMQLYATAMKPVGAGAAQRALEALRRRLAAEGLFATDRKRPLPFLPSVVGVVTSRTGAAVHDIIVTLRRRFPGVHVVLAASVVQGSDAPRSIVAALARLEACGLCDVVILGRGGGAAEDLAAFNDEAVVRAVARFPVPVVSAVGHEVDVSLCDLVADLRAATPTAAAEAVVPVRSELLAAVETAAHRLRSAAHRRVGELRMGVEATAGRLRHPAARIADLRQRADRYAMLLERALRGRVAGRARRLGELAAALDALSPLAVLERGYSLAVDASGRIVRDAGDLKEGDRVELRFHRGRVGADIAWREIDGSPGTGPQPGMERPGGSEKVRGIDKVRED
ncbi:MAG: exodeoxyribonuclease VII large subunit [Candidatus Binatia bacterium]